MAKINDPVIKAPMSSQPSTKSHRVTKPTTKKGSRGGPKRVRDPDAIYFGSAWKGHAHTFPLSNMARNKILFDGTIYPTSEQLYQVERLRRGIAWLDVRLDDSEDPDEDKAKLHEGIQAIMAENRSPKKAKEVSKVYQQYLPEELKRAWEGELGLEVMWGVLLAKFEAETEAGARARKALLDTGDKTLIQSASRCPRWGVDGKTLEGENELGKMLVRMRERLRRDGRWTEGDAHGLVEAGGVTRAED